MEGVKPNPEGSFHEGDAATHQEAAVVLILGYGDLFI